MAWNDDNLKVEILNAQIYDTNFVRERDHDFVYLSLKIKVQDGGIVNQTIGAGSWDRDYDYESGDCYGTQYHDFSTAAVALMMLCDVIGVDSLNSMKNQYIRVKESGTGCGKKILAIGNLMEDKWFSLEKFYTIKNEKRTYNSGTYLEGLDVNFVD